MGNSKQLLLFFLLVMVKWEYVVSGYEVPMGIVSTAVLPSDDEEEVQETREPANVVMNEIPVQEHQEMIPHLNKESFPANRLLNLFDSSGSSTNVYNSLATFLSRQNLSPGKTTRVEIIPPEGSQADFVNTLMGNIKVIVPKLVPNAPVSFKLSATRNIDDTLKKITLDIIVGPAVQDTFNRFGDDENPKSITLSPINVDLTSEPAKQDIPITSALINGVKQAKPYIDSGKSSTIVLRISPPAGFGSNDEQNTIRRITRILNQLVPSNVRTVVQGRSSNYPDGTVRNIDVKILLEPIQESNGGENIEIDLSSPDEDIQKTLRDNLLLILQDERSKRFNLLIIPPVGTTPESSENIANMVNSILLQLIPNRKPALKYRISQQPNGYVNKIYVEIDIEPSNTHKNPIDLHFDVNLSIPNTNIREEVLRIIPKVKNTLSQQPNEPVSFTMDIKPPKGATDEYVTETLKNVQETLLDVLPTHRIGVHARITKDSQGNIVNISIISNIEPTERNSGNELNFDLSKPERNLVDYLIEFTPQLKNILGKKEPKNEPATLTLNIQPPTGANDQFVRNSMNTVTTFLSKLLPDKEISVEAKASKDPNGNVISTSLFITSKPGATTEEPKNPEEITVDLSDLTSI
ncbi:hypothetical protein WA026_016149 [Henosepilachna vigintioctopunctata]|uniref:Uncharacterized protein n=1 Tax=Henosepilachna vigintioctopunctata TaxID=420089 RepID=A0AAW1TWA6_9CUCU